MKNAVRDTDDPLNEVLAASGVAEDMRPAWNAFLRQMIVPGSVSPGDQFFHIYFEAEKVPPSARSAILTQLRQLISQAKKSADRPKWRDRFDHPDLVRLSAPAFLKLVHADDIQNNVVVKDEMRRIDPELINRVESYISQREARDTADLGDAAGLIFVASKAPTNKREPKRAPPKPLVGGAKRSP